MATSDEVLQVETDARSRPPFSSAAAAVAFDATPPRVEDGMSFRMLSCAVVVGAVSFGVPTFADTGGTAGALGVAVAPAKEPVVDAAEVKVVDDASIVAPREGAEQKAARDEAPVRKAKVKAVAPDRRYTERDFGG